MICEVDPAPKYTNDVVFMIYILNFANCRIYNISSDHITVRKRFWISWKAHWNVFNGFIQRESSLISSPALTSNSIDKYDVFERSLRGTLGKIQIPLK